MNLPVASLIVPTVLIGWLMFGGENSPWSHFFAQQFPHPALAAAPVSETVTGVIAFAIVIVGIAIAWMRYGVAPAQANAVPRLREESIRMPAVLTHAFYFDDALDFLFVRPAQLLGTLFGRFVDPQVIDGAVRETVFSAQWLGTLMRSFQTGLLRTYAFLLVIGATCFMVYYAVAAGGGR
jgi:NADH-quinone oxidoreductase subunit L